MEGLSLPKAEQPKNKKKIQAIGKQRQKVNTEAAAQAVGVSLVLIPF